MMGTKSISCISIINGKTNHDGRFPFKRHSIKKTTIYLFKLQQAIKGKL